MGKLVVANPWESLRRFTQARIALGRAGVSIPTKPLLDFQFAHARARDAVHLPMDCARIFARLEAAGYPVIELHSAVSDRIDLSAASRPRPPARRGLAQEARRLRRRGRARLRHRLRRRRRPFRLRGQ